MFYAFLGLSGLITYFSLKNTNILLRMGAALSWLAMAFWAIYGTNTPFLMTDGYSLMMVAVMVIMALVPLVIHMDTEITREYKGLKWSERKSKKSLDAMIKRDEPSVYDKHRVELRSKLRRRR